MDKRAKKRIEVLRKRLTKLHLQLAGAKEQIDDPEDAKRFEAEIQEAEAEIAKWKAQD